MDQVKGSTAPTVRTCHIQDGAQSPGQTQWAACGKVGGLLGTRDTPELLLPYVTSFPQMTAHNDITQMGPSPKEPAFPRSFVPTSIKPRADGKEGAALPALVASGSRDAQAMLQLCPVPPARLAALSRHLERMSPGVRGEGWPLGEGFQHKASALQVTFLVLLKLIKPVCSTQLHDCASACHQPCPWGTCGDSGGPGDWVGTRGSSSADCCGSRRGLEGTAFPDFRKNSTLTPV